MMNKLKGEANLPLNGKKVPCVLNMAAFQFMSEEFNYSLSDLNEIITPVMKDEKGEVVLSEDGSPKIDQAKSMGGFAKIAYCGVVNGYDRKGKEFKMGFRQFKAFFLEDEAGLEVIGDLLGKVFAAAAESQEEEDSGNE